MAISRLRLVAVIVVALAVGFVTGTWRSGVHIETGRADSTASGGGSIITDDWTYAFYSDMAWTDRNNAYHDSGLPECLQPLSSVEDVRFAWIEVTVEGSTWRQTAWIDCRSARAAPSSSSAPIEPSPSDEATSYPMPNQPAATLVFRTAEPPHSAAPSTDVGCAGVGLGPFTLHGTERGSEVLVWLEQDDHRQFAAVWPNGFTAEFNPELALRDAEGNVVAREGDIIEGGGAQDERYSNLLLVWSFNGLSYPCVNAWVEPLTELATNVLHDDDNLDILRRDLPDAAVDLVYLDQPCNSGPNR